MAQSYQFRLPFPPSVNGYWRTWKGRTLISKAGRKFREEAVGIIHAESVGAERLTDRLRVQLELTPPTKHRRDIDNYAKSTLDAITHSGLIEDDELIDVLHIRRMPVCSPGCVDVLLEVIE